MDPAKIQSITIGGSDDVVLPMIAGERHSLAISVVLDGPLEDQVTRNACLELVDNELLGFHTVLVSGEVPIASGAAATDQPRTGFDLTCTIDQKVWGLTAPNAVPPSERKSTNEKKTKIFVQGSFGGVKSNKVKVRCPDVVTTGP